MAPRWLFFFDWREYGKYGTTAGEMLAGCTMYSHSAAAKLTSDGFGRAALAGGDHDEHFHDIVIDSEQSVSPLARNAGILLAAAALHDEDVLVTD
jgi:hypothetical protein